MALTYTTTVFPPAFLGVPYDAGIGVTGGIAISALAVNTGALPTGLTISTTTDNRIIGTPTATGLFTFTLTCAGVVSGTYTIKVYGTISDPYRTGEFATPTADAFKRKLN
jgi:Putative Ig domain